MPRKRNPTAVPPPSADAFLMGIPEVARRLNTTVPAVRELIRSGRLKYAQIGHKMLTSPVAIQDFIVANERYYKDESAPSTRTADLVLMDLPECARRMSTTVFAVRDMARSDKIKFVWVGQKMLFSPAAIEDFIRTNEAYYSAHRSDNEAKAAGA